MKNCSFDVVYSSVSQCSLKCFELFVTPTLIRETESVEAHRALNGIDSSKCSSELERNESE